MAQALTLEEAQARRDRLAKMRALLFYHELKAKRVKAIKSKEYHRRLNRAAKRKAAKAGEAGDDEEALRAAAEDAEFQRAKVGCWDWKGLEEILGRGVMLSFLFRKDPHTSPHQHSRHGEPSNMHLDSSSVNQAIRGQEGGSSWQIQCAGPAGCS